MYNVARNQAEMLPPLKEKHQQRKKFPWKKDKKSNTLYSRNPKIKEREKQNNARL